MERHITLWAYLWDLVDDGLEEAVRRCRNEIGLDALSVATAYHSVQQLRPGRPGKKLWVADQAAVYFQPDLRLYVDTCIAPPVAPLAARDNPLAELADACQAHGLGLISWTVCLHNSYLATRYPHCAQQTAYGDNLGWALCPGADDVRAYLLALCRDLATHYGVSRLELESCNFGGYGHAHYHLKDGVELGAIGRYLFSLSFSSGCMAKARQRGIDAEGLRDWVRRQLDPIFAGDQPPTGELEPFIAAHPELAAFQALREDLVISLVEEIKTATGVEVSFLLMGDRWQAGIDPRRIGATADLVEVLAYTPTPAVVGERVSQTLAALDDPGRLVLGLQAYPPCATSAAQLQANVEQGRALGVNKFSFYNYGIGPPRCLDWIGQCLGRC